METRSLALPPEKARHPKTGKPVTIVGVTDEETSNPKAVVKVTDQHGTHFETVEWVDNDR